MSSNTRTTSKGGKGSKGDKAHKTDKSDTGKGSGDKQHNLGNDNNRSKSDDAQIKEKVKQLVEMTQRDENEVCLVLHECEYDVELACNMLFESNEKGTWETTVKKKKNRQASASKTEATEAAAAVAAAAGGDEWNDTQGQNEDKPKSRSKSGGPPRLHGRNNDSRGWKGREKQENEKNNEDGGRSDFRDRRSRPGGPTRGGGGGRGRGGGRAGGRYPPRGNRSNYNSRPIETWDNSNTWDNSTAAAATAAAATTNHTEENWDDFPGTDEWSTEEYTGSLADTKVFTPSVQVDTPLTEHNDSSIAATGGSIDTTNLSNNQQLAQTLEIRNQQSPVPIVGGTLSAAQTQYLNQLTQQTSENMKTQYSNATVVQGYGTGQTQIYEKGNTTSAYNNSASNVSQYNAVNTQQYGNPPNNAYGNSGYGVNSNYGGTTEQPVHQPVRTKTQRARVPPPSKIPSSAVEMPGDLNSSIAYLDVQFGAMDMLDSNSFDNVSDVKFGATNNTNLESTNVASNANLDLSAAAQNTTAIDAYTSAKPNTQSSISSAISQGLTNTDSIPTTEHLSSTYSATASRGSTTGGSTAASSVTPSALDLNKSAEPHSYSNQSSYSSYQPKSSSFHSSSYTGAHVTSSSYVSNPASNSYTNSSATSYNAPNAANSYQNAYSATGSYQSAANAAAFPSISQANSYPSNQTYPQNTSQSVYGANTGLNNSSNYSSTTGSTNQYNSYGGSNHKLVKDSSGYDSSTTAASSVPVTTNSVSSAALSLNQSTAATTKVTTTLAKNSSNVVSNIPPGVTPVMSTPYMIGQVPFFQPPMYAAYEDVQLIQQRIPHLTTPYYDMSYQTPTTLTAVRDGTLANVAYSMSDGRFTRGDNNASPVPSTLSQQTSTLTQGHQAQPILAQTAGHPGWIYPSTYNPMTPSYQFGVMYPQLPQATNAHGSSNSSQYPKPATYGSGYGSGYETLSQSQDYTKSAYVGNTQGQNKATGANASSVGSGGSDLTAMYGKSHAALGKVNSYEKQGFHSGTPPPFTGTVHGSQNAGLAPSGTGYGPQMFIQTMAPHQQHHSHSTPLMHQPLHQIEVRHQGRRMDSGSSSGQRSQSSNQAKTASKQGYPPSYWNQA